MGSASAPYATGISTPERPCVYKLRADAYLYGAVRAMNKVGEPVVVSVSRTKKQTTTFQRVFVEMNLRIVADNEDVLWSKTIAESFDTMDLRPATPEELKIDFKWIVLGVIGGLVLLVIVLIVIKGIVANVKIR